MKYILGIIGKMQSGKSTITDFLIKHHDFVEYAMAWPLKNMLLKAGIPYKELYEKKSEKARFLMQFVGTEIFRNQIDKDYWVKLARKQKELNSIIIKKIVISDIRFPNEAQMVKDYGGYLIRVVRQKQDITGDSTHDSEVLQDTIETDVTIYNDGSLEELYNNVDDKLNDFYNRVPPINIRLV